LKKFFVLPALPSNENNSFDHHNSYNKGPNLAFFSFRESPSNSLLSIKFPKNYITSFYHRNLPKTAKAIFGHQRALGAIQCQMHPMEQKFAIFLDSLLRTILKTTNKVQSIAKMF
jgi:hypothetical protein